MEGVFSGVLYPDAVQEWLAVNVDVKIERMSTVVNDAMSQVKIGGRVKDYPVKMDKDEENMSS
jgi:hypothetical protein